MNILEADGCARAITAATLAGFAVFFTMAIVLSDLFPNSFHLLWPIKDRKATVIYKRRTPCTFWSWFDLQSPLSG